MKLTSQQWLIGGAVVVLIALAVLLNRSGSPSGTEGDESPSPSVSAAVGTTNPKPKATATPNTPELTSSVGNYVCAGGKKFTLTVRTDGTARVSGSDSSNSKILRKTSIGIWVSDDSATSVREIAGYTVLIENGTTTRDSCYLKK